MLKGRKVIILGISCFLIIAAMPVVVSEDAKSDLIIENIIKKECGHRIPPVYGFYCRVKNIGDVAVEKMIFVSVKVYRLFFEFFPIPCVFFRYIGSDNYDQGLEPGRSIDIEFANGMAYLPIFPPWFSDYLVVANVNPFHFIDESDFSNNFFTKKSYGWWD